MQQSSPSGSALRRRRGSRTVACAAGVGVLLASVLTATEAASADPAADINDLQSAFSAGAPVVDVTGDIDASSSTLTLAPGASTVLNLHGSTLRLDTLQLTSVDSSLHAQGSTLTVTGGGTLIVAHTSDATRAAIEVDSVSSLTIDDVAVQASVTSTSKAAAIGGGAVGGSSQSAGTIVLQNGADVTAVGGSTGAAIGGGNRGGGGSITISDATVGATSVGSGAAIGGGANPASGAVGNVTVVNHSVVSATATGDGSAIGGGVAGGGGSITVGDFAKVKADASAGQVAIGDGPGADQGMYFTTSLSSSVTARGGSGAGIGSANGAAGQDAIQILDRSTVVASSVNGPGIGGTGNTHVPTVDVRGTATVSAFGGNGGAGIGAGDSSSYGAALSIENGASVTVGAGSASALGSSTGSRFGTVSNNGALTLPAGQQITVPLGAQVTNSGSFSNSGTVSVRGEFDNGGSITNNGVFTGNGFVSNYGSITQFGTFDTAVEGSFFHIVYDAQGGGSSLLEQYLYAPTFRSVGMSLPTATPPTIGYFSGWNTSPDGSGSTLNDRVSLTDLAPLSTTAHPTVLRVYALYQLQPVMRTDRNLPQGVVGTAYSASVAATSGTAPITYSYTGDLPAGLSIDASSGLITGTPTTSGTFTMHLTGRNAAGPTTHDYTIQIVATLLHVSTPLTPSGAPRYLAGGRLDVAISGLQANESYTVTVGGKPVVSGRAPTNQEFSVRTTVPKSIGDGVQTVRLTGADHALTATSSIRTAAVAKSLGLKLSAKKVKAKKKLVVSVSKLYAGESVRVVISGKHGKVTVGKASAKGTYVLTLKKGLAKGKYTVTVTGAGTSRKASAKLTVS